MIQTRAGDLLSVMTDDGAITFAVLTKKLLFGGNWCYVFYKTSAEQPDGHHGFNAFVDCIVPKRDGRVTRLSGGIDLSTFIGNELLTQQPTRYKKSFSIIQWTHPSIASVNHIRTT